MKRRVVDLGAGETVNWKSAVLAASRRSTPGFALAIMPCKVWLSILFFASSDAGHDVDPGGRAAGRVRSHVRSAAPVRTM